ncbi:hypothetical protein KR222_011340 [Zaprionus bogoriensis]|nr:hypothetical protein KR222_011340 [Zaprionus bogoriensis]
MAKHYEKPPKELQHICPYADCSFATLRWDNLNRHISRVHRVTKPQVEEQQQQAAAAATGAAKEEQEQQTTHTLEQLEKLPALEHAVIMSSVEQNAELMSSYEQTASIASETELEAMFCEEIPAEAQTAAPAARQPPLEKAPKEPKTRKPRKSYKSGKTKYYECKKCEYRTKRGYNIKRHLDKHMAEQGPSEKLLYHVCVISGCGFSTPRWDNLCRHVKRVHPEAVARQPNES